MPDLPEPPDHVRAAFREHLIEHGGSQSNYFGLGHNEEIKRLRFYLETFENFISEEESAELASLQAKATKLSIDAESEFWSWYYPVHWDDIFRTNLRSSFLISLMSVIESRTTEVCRDVALIARTPIQVNDLKGALLERAQLFLDKFARFSKPTAETWRKVYRVYDVRNVFVHYAGFLPPYKHHNRIRQFMQASGGIKETNGTLLLTREFCPLVLDTAQLFLEDIFTELSLLCDRVRTFEASTR